MLLRAVANARAALQAGVTTLRDLGSRGQVIYELRDAINKRIIPGPRVLSSGAPITCMGGHLHFLGGVAEGRDGIARMTEERVEEGADVIKVIATGGNMTTTSDPLKAQFTTKEMEAAVEVANANGLKVTVHARGVEGIRAAIRAGCTGSSTPVWRYLRESGSSTMSWVGKWPIAGSPPPQLLPPVTAHFSVRRRGQKWV